MQDRLDDILLRRAADFRERRLNCAEAVLMTLAEYFGFENALMPRIATAFGGGMASTQATCGAATGALMALSVLFGRDYGGSSPAMDGIGRRFLERFAQAEGSTVCAEITGVNFGDAEQLAAFRAPGSRRQSVCEPLLSVACRVARDIAESERARV